MAFAPVPLRQPCAPVASAAAPHARSARRCTRLSLCSSRRWRPLSLPPPPPSRSDAPGTAARATRGLLRAPSPALAGAASYLRSCRPPARPPARGAGRRPRTVGPVRRGAGAAGAGWSRIPPATHPQGKGGDAEEGRRGAEQAPAVQAPAAAQVGAGRPGRGRSMHGGWVQNNNWLSCTHWQRTHPAVAYGHRRPTNTSSAPRNSAQVRLRACIHADNQLARLRRRPFWPPPHLPNCLPIGRRMFRRRLWSHTPGQHTKRTEKHRASTPARAHPCRQLGLHQNARS